LVPGQEALLYRHHSRHQRAQTGRAKFQSVTESAIDAIISADHTGNIVSWNNAATRILGYSAEEATGQRLELIIPERFHEAHRTGMQRVTAGGESRVIGTKVELFARTKSGKEVPIELSLSTWTDGWSKFLKTVSGEPNLRGPIK